ncbi:MAG: AGE family epimerase/isomerase [Salinivenus sp.]
MAASLLRSLFIAALLPSLLAAGCVPTAQGQPVPDAEAWRTQGLEILSAWTDRGQSADSLFYAELDRTWTPQGDSTVVYPGMLARHLYSMSAAYLMSGDSAHLRRATRLRDFVIEHGWDPEYGGWYNAVSRSGDVVDTEKDLFMQIYATTGLALHYIATRDSTTKEVLDRSRQFMRDHAWDERHGGYVDVLRRDGSVTQTRKDFSPQLAPLSGYLLFLYPATRDSTYLREAEEIMDLTLTHMQGPDGWIRERFARDWTFLPDDDKNSHLNVGHNLEVAWLLLRLHALTGAERYREKGLALTDRLLEEAFHEQTGAWLHKLRRTDRSQHPDTAVWWVQAYGNMLQLYAYRTTGAPRYLDAFRSGARFWTDHFVDAEHGGTVLRTTLDGEVVDGDKAARTKTSYHAVEHALLLSLYTDLWVEDTTTTLHYRPERGGPLHPLPVEAQAPTIERVWFHGEAQSPLPTTDDGSTLSLPDRPPTLTVDVADSTARRP